MAISAAQLNVRIQTEGAAAAKRDINDVGSAVDNSAAKSRMLGTGLLGMGGMIATVFTGSAVAAIGFGEQMANVNSIAQLTTGELSALSDQVIDLSTNTGQSATVLAAGLYDIQSSGFAGADALSILGVSATAANAGLTTTDVSARAITASLNAYGLTAADAGHVSDVLFKTVDEGVVSFEQLANNLGNTLPLANATGVSIEELGAAYARMTLSGVGVSQAETQIAALMRAAINPTTELTAAVQDYGYASVESLIAAEGMTGYLDLLTKASGGTTEGLFELLGTAEATNAALLLGGENADEYAASVERMKASSEGLGATQTALAKQMESTAFSLRLLKTNVQAAAIAIGVQLEPGIRFVAKAMTGMLKGFLNLSKPVQKIIGVITALAGVLALAAGAWILFGSQITMAAGLFLSILGPIALVVAAVAGLYYAWQTNLFGIRDIAQDVFGGIMDFVSPVTDFLGRFMDAWNGPSDVMDKINSWGGLNADGTTKSVMDQINAWGSLTKEMSIAERAMNALDVASGGMITNMRQGFSALKNVGQEVIGLFASGDFSDAFSRIGDIFQNSALGRAIGDMVVSIPSVAVSVGKWVMGAGANLYETVKPWVDAAIGAVSGVVQQIPSVAVSVGQWLMEAGANLYDVVKPWIDAAISAVSGIVQQIPSVAVSIGQWLMEAGANLYDVVKPWVDAAISAISGIVQQIPEVAVTVGAWIMQAGANLYDVVEPWIEAAVGAASGIIHSIPSVAVSVGAWAMRAGANLYDVVQPWIEAAVGAVSGIVHSIPEVAASIGAWVMRAGANLYDVVGPWIEAAVGAVSGIVHSIPEVAISIGQWVKSGWKDLSPWVQQNVALSWVGNEGAPFNLGTVSVKIADFDGTVDFGALYAKVNEWFTTGSTLSESQLSGIEDFGNTLGRKAMQLLIRGVQAAFSGGGGAADMMNAPGGQRAGGGGVSGADAINAAIGRLFRGMFNGMGDVFSEEVAPLLQEKADEIIAGVQEWWSGLTRKISSAFSGGGGMVSAPGGMRAAGGSSGIGKALQAFSDSIGEQLQTWAEGLGSLFSDLSWPDLSLPDFPKITMPTINWPGPPSIPDWIKDPAKWVQDQISGGGSKDVAQGVAPQGGGGEIGPLVSAPRPELIPNLVQQVQLAVDNADALAKIQAVKDAIAGLGGGGIGRAAMGAGAGAGIAAATISVDTSAAMTALSGLSLAMNTAIVAVATGMTTIQAVVQNAMNGIIVAVASITTAQAVIQASVNGMIVAVATGFTTMQSVVQAAVNGMIVAVATSMTTMRAVVAAQMAGVTAAIVSGMGTARAATVAGAAAMSASMIAGMAAFRNAVTSGMAAAAGAVRSGVAQMVGAASAGRGAMASAGQGIGAALGQGIAAGIRGQIGAVAAAAASLVQTAVAAARSAGAIRSPSKVMHDQIGLMLGLGVERGILDSIAGINRAAGLMVPSLGSSTGSGSLASTGAAGNNAPTYIVNVTVEGNVTSERTLTATITREIANGIRSDLIRHRTASGVAQ